MSQQDDGVRTTDGRMLDRFNFFTDAVFAIVLTLLVLELHAPEIHNTDPAALWAALGAMWPHFFAFLVSFALAALWWSVHMRVVRSLAAFDWPTAICNLVFLFFVSLIPFVAALLGTNIENPTSWQAYWGVNAAAAFVMGLMVFVATRGQGRLLALRMSGGERAFRILQSVILGIAFAVGAWLAARGELALSRYCWIVIPPLMLLARLLHRPAKKPKPQAD